MENQPKLNNSKEVIAFLAKQFPLCFVAEGEARPLKIGIFQDIVQRLSDVDCVSKTQIRTALRLYTTSWRYLYGIKVGAERVDLDGNPCGVLEEQHVDHARKQLEEAKARVQAQKNAQREAAKALDKSKGAAKSPETKKADSAESATSKVAKTKPAPARKAVAKVEKAAEPVGKTASLLDIANLKIGQPVRVKAGKSAMDATVIEVVRDGARVQLASGMAMIVRAEHIQL